MTQEIQLDEVFDAQQIYPVTNLTPKAKVPQIIHVQAPGTNDIVVRLTSSDTIGTRVKAVKPGDKVVQVFLTSMSDKGNITDFKGGLGSDPIGAINTIFDTVIAICKEYRIEAILFRFPKSKMKGKDHVAQRIIQRLTKTRSGGRYTTLDEVEGLSKKFAFSLLYRKGKVLQDVPGIPDIDPAKFEKVDTKVGETYVNVETGQSVSKSEAIAQTVVDAASKTSPQQVVAITKVSRQAVINQLYSYTADDLKEYPKDKRDKFDEYNQTNSVVQSDSISKDIMFQLNNSFDSFKAETEMKSMFENVLEHQINLSDIKTSPDDVVNGIISIVRAGKVDDTFETMYKAIQYVKENTHTTEAASRLIGTIPYLYMRVMNPVLQLTTADAFYTFEQKQAIKHYTNEGYDEMNSFLRGDGKNASNTIIDKLIPQLDSAFDNGTTLSKDMIVYRGQRMSPQDVDVMLKHKLYVFRTFVSTSIAPIIFGTTFGNSGDALSIDDEGTIDEGRDGLYKVGFVIKGLNKIKTVVPGKISGHPRECEVILPRGLVLKINEVHRHNEKIMLICTVDTNVQIEESTEVPFGFAQMYMAESTSKVSEREKSEMTEFIGLSIPKKFRM